MDYRKSYAIYWGVIWLALILAVAYFLTHWLWTAVAALTLLLAGMLQTVFFYRCPECGKSLNPRTKQPKYCPHCGNELDV